MATPVFCCGGECGRIAAAGANNGEHLTILNGTPTIDTTTTRSGARSIRCNGTQDFVWVIGGSATRLVGRVYIRFTTLPSADSTLLAYDTAFAGPQIRYVNTGTEIRCRVGTTNGSTGVLVTTGIWYRIDFDFNVNTGGNDFCDAQVDGVALGQATAAGSSAANDGRFYGGTTSGDVYFEDCILSNTAADYPLGAGHVTSFIPNADGAHNVAGAADFKHNAAGTDITNSTTDAFDLVNDRPLKAGAPDTEFMNMIAPPNATDYVEVAFEDATGEANGPRAVEVIAKVAQAGTGLGNMELRLNDNGSMGTIYTATGVAGIVNGKYVGARFTDPPSAASAWVLGGAGNGDFNNVRVRFGSPAAVDANPDQYLVSIMIEAEFEELAPPSQPNMVSQMAAQANW
jgi:hypothetical protein